MPFNNAAERSLRGIAITRKNYLFLGSDAGGERAAILYTVLESAKLNGLDPQTWLSNVIDRMYPSGEGRLALRRRLGAVWKHRCKVTVLCTSARDGAMARVEVITGPERRRRWSEEQKRAIVAASLAPGAVVSRCGAARRYFGLGQIYRWRKEFARRRRRFCAGADRVARHGQRLTSGRGPVR